MKTVSSPGRDETVIVPFRTAALVEISGQPDPGVRPSPDGVGGVEEEVDEGLLEELGVGQDLQGLRRWLIIAVYL